MYTLDLEKAEEQEIKFPTSPGSSKKKKRRVQKKSTSALLTMLKIFTVWVITDCGKIIKETGIPDYLTCLLRNQYVGQKATVRTGHGTTDWFQIRKEVHQGRILSPYLLTSMQSTT